MFSLSLQYNKLRELRTNGFLAFTTALTQLDLSNNLLRNLPGKIFYNLTNLKSLSLAFNLFSSLPVGLFDRLCLLTVLYLHYNQLSGIPDNLFLHLDKLTTLYLNGNQIRNLTVETFRGNVNIVTLGLQCNKITTISAGILAAMQVPFLTIAHTDCGPYLHSLKLAFLLLYRGGGYVRHHLHLRY